MTLTFTPADELPTARRIDFNSDPFVQQFASMDDGEVVSLPVGDNPKALIKAARRAARFLGRGVSVRAIDGYLFFKVHPKIKRPRKPKADA